MSLKEKYKQFQYYFLGNILEANTDFYTQRQAKVLFFLILIFVLNFTSLITSLFVTGAPMLLNVAHGVGWVGYVMALISFKFTNNLNLPRSIFVAFTLITATFINLFVHGEYNELIGLAIMSGMFLLIFILPRKYAMYSTIYFMVMNAIMAMDTIYEWRLFEIGLQYSNEAELNNPISYIMIPILAIIVAFQYLKTQEKTVSIVRAQNDELEIELASQRVRNEAMEMKSSKDFPSILVTMKEEFEKFNLGNVGIWFWVIDEEANTVSQWDLGQLNPEIEQTSINITIEIDAFSLPREHKKHWPNKDYYTVHFKGEKLKTVFKELEVVDSETSEILLKAFEEGKLTELWSVCASYSNIIVALDYDEEPPTRVKDVLTKITKAFGLSFKRYEDLQTAESQAELIREERDRLKIAHENLKSTQTQLIHAEKMASLGELTAGIAHEIQNPLNFVNNFSEVSSELLEEMDEEIEKGDFEEVKFISKDIKQNLEKINHHGKRADAIVKGMLAHSRTGKGEKEPTDINQLADEYLRLSYHGLRAKDKNFNAEFKTDFDPELPKVNVIPQDIGRVLLNLVNNAFQACTEVGQNESIERSRNAEMYASTSM